MHRRIAGNSTNHIKNTYISSDDESVVIRPILLLNMK